MQGTFRSRIAPTPSGFLHLGNAFNFILTALLVDSEKGQLHLRIDDFDNSRLNKKSVEDIFIQLDWLGIEYNSGPTGPDELFSKYSQKLKNDFYHSAIEILRKKKYIFACECTRSKIKLLSTKNKYPGICRFKGMDFKTKNIPWRMLVPEGTLIKYKTYYNSIKKIRIDLEMGDFIIKRRDGLPAYQIVSLLEDLEQGINLIVRGQDLIASTGAQLFIAKCLNKNKFLDSKFVHHKLIKNNSGKKLSKSFGDLSLRALKEKMKTPTFIYQEIARILDLKFKDIISFDHLKHSFKISKNQTNLSKILNK